MLPERDERYGKRSFPSGDSPSENNLRKIGPDLLALGIDTEVLLWYNVNMMKAVTRLLH